jgi:peptide/nickel transport system permease protein
MLRNIAKRFFQTIPILFGVALLIFLMLRIIPGDVATTLMGEHVNRESIERMTEELGLDQPVYVQFFKYIFGAVQGNFGTSYYLNRSVKDLLAIAFPYTVKLALAAAVVAWTIGITAGIFAAVRKNGILDHLFMGFSLLGISMPVFMVAMILQYFFAFRIQALPLEGAVGFRSYIIPAIALGWNSAGSIARMTRSALLETLQEDYIDTAAAKGRGRVGIITAHALRNALLPVVTMMALQISSLLSGAVITETIFSIPGIGRLAVQAISNRDIPLLQGTVLFTTVIVIAGNLLADCLYAVLDPRIREAK